MFLDAETNRNHGIPRGDQGSGLTVRASLRHVSLRLVTPSDADLSSPDGY
jgi:hypothetical protein